MSVSPQPRKLYIKRGISLLPTNTMDFPVFPSPIELNARLPSIHELDSSIKDDNTPLLAPEPVQHNILKLLEEFYPNPSADADPAPLPYKSFTPPPSGNSFLNSYMPFVVSDEQGRMSPSFQRSPSLAPSTSPNLANSPLPAAMDWSMLSPISMYEQLPSTSGPMRRKSSTSSIASISSVGSNKAAAKTLSCPQQGCYSTFSKTKHLKRHMLKHGQHQHKCTVPGCQVTSYRSDMIKQHIKGCCFGQY
ncbi:MAG: hypothetical protein SGCHY_002873 [Lobulomycetales sp.]